MLELSKEEMEEMLYLHAKENGCVCCDRMAVFAVTLQTLPWRTKK